MEVGRTETGGGESLLFLTDEQLRKGIEAIYQKGKGVKK